MDSAKVSNHPPTSVAIFAKGCFMCVCLCISALCRRNPRRRKPWLLLLTAGPTGTSPICSMLTNLSCSVADHFAPKRASVHASEVFFHCRCQQRNVRDLAQIFGDEPDGFFGRHPVKMIEARQIHRE